MKTQDKWGVKRTPISLLREINDLRLVAGAACKLMKVGLGDREGYFTSAGATVTATLRDALESAGYKIWEEDK